MERFVDAFPTLAAELIRSTAVAARADLEEQLRTATIATVTFDTAARAAYVCVSPTRPPNVVEQNVIGVRHGETIPLACNHHVNLDIDNFGRLSGIEILNPDDLTIELKRRSMV
jgi:uncharacterized protein YuzE